MARPENLWQIFLLELDTGRIQKVFEEEANCSFPCWSPDGQAIAFNTDIWGGEELAKYEIDKSLLTRLTDAPGKNFLADWSPDGKSLAFSGNRILGWHVFLLHLATGKIDRLTGRGNCRPHWSPDGRWIAYVSGQGNHDIAIMKATAIVRETRASCISDSV